MKEPWEILHDEYKIELARRGSRGDDGRRQLSDESLQEMGVAVHTAFLEHLINVEKWRKEDALELLDHLKTEGFGAPKSWV